MKFTAIKKDNFIRIGHINSCTVDFLKQGHITNRGALIAQALFWIFSVFIIQFAASGDEGSPHITHTHTHTHTVNDIIFSYIIMTPNFTKLNSFPLVVLK